MGKSIAFRMGYLLGLSIENLKKISLEEYENSACLSHFLNYVDAKTLRCLCSIRNGVILNYTVDSEKGIISAFLNRKFLVELEYLRLKDIDILWLLGTCNFIKFINLLNEMVNILSYKILVDLDLPFVDELLSYFVFPKMNRSDYLKIKQLNRVINPFKIVVPDMYKLDVVFKYLFKKDDYILINAFTLLNKKPFKFKLYTYAYRTEMGVDLDESAVVDLKLLFDSYTDKYEKSNNTVIQKTESIKNQMLNNLQCARLPKLEKRIVNPLTIENSSIFIDCNNIDFFKTLCFLNALEVQKRVNSVTLFVDDKSNIFWLNFDKFYSGNLKINIIHLSVSIHSLNIRITKEICSAIYECKKSYILLCSNNTEFYGLFESFENIKFICCSTANNQEYLNYLRKYKVLNYNISELETQDLLDAYRILMVFFSFISYISKEVISLFDKSKIYKWVLNDLKKETSLNLKEKEVFKYVSMCYDSVALEIEENVVKIKLEDIEIKI